jgi:exopolysaccharide biosynthesis WecB/TagA/CpsF family protein
MTSIAGTVRQDGVTGALAVLPTRDILGVPVAIADTATAQLHLDERLSNGRSTCVAFLNAHGSNVAASNSTLAAALRQWIVFNDGIGVDIALRVLHKLRFLENLNGTDFVPRYLRDTRHVLRVFVLGGEIGIAERAIAEFRREAPRHKYVDAHHGYFKASEIPAVVARIREARADVLIVALGTPLQELWLVNHFPATQCRLAFCVGGLLDFVSGAKPRAPRWVRRLRLEWIYRLMLEPRRMWRRYLLGNVQFLGRLAVAAARR